jgi:ribosomal subunit interface protein
MLNIKIKTNNFEKTPAIEDYVSKKVSSLEKFLDQNESILCEVELGKTTSHHKSGDIFKAEINIVEAKGRQYFVVAEESDLYAAIDVVRDNAEEVIVSKKKKANTLFRRGASQIKGLLKRINRR